MCLEMKYFLLSEIKSGCWFKYEKHYRKTSYIVIFYSVFEV